MPTIHSDRRAPAADFLRAASIFIIAWYHIWQQSWLNPNIQTGRIYINIYPLISHGYMFVDIMLLISGFVLYLGYLDGRYESLKKYYLSRAFRILPCYLLCVLVLFFAQALPNHAYGSTEYMLKDLLSHLTFTHNLFREGYTGTQLNAVLWTLAVEVQFYVMFPFIAKVFKRLPYVTYPVMLAVSLASKLWVYYVPDELSLYINRLPAMLDVYANGMLAALIYTKLRKHDHFITRCLYTPLIALACIGIYHILTQQSYLGDPTKERLGQMFFRFPLTVCGASFLIFGSLALKSIRFVFSNPITRFLGMISYNFYIWHQYLAVKLKAWHIPDYVSDAPNVNGEQPWQLRYTLICFAFAFIVSVLLTYIIEKPCSRVGNRIIARLK